MEAARSDCDAVEVRLPIRASQPGREFLGIQHLNLEVPDSWSDLPQVAHHHDKGWLDGLQFLELFNVRKVARDSWLVLFDNVK